LTCAGEKPDISGGMTIPELRQMAQELVRGAGRILLRHFGRIKHIRQKEHPSSVVCEADLASEKYIIQRIRARFPDHGIIAEESGFIRGGSEYTWVIDPLDGTSNFIAGIPWFGAQLGILHRGKPVVTAIYVPVSDALYLAQKGKGAFRNGRRLRVTSETQLKRVLCAFGFDSAADARKNRLQARLLMRVAAGVRNTRATNSLIDFCYTLEGHFGGCVNLNCKIWDIVPVSLMLPEAGGVFTDLAGRPIRFRLDEKDFGGSYQVLGSTRSLHPRLVACLNGK
jgi:myo-inositol-1(or 4)-monophosphatase